MAKILQKMTISISNLPETCSMKGMLQSYVASPSSSVNVVLTLDGGQYIAYIGYPDKKDLKDELKSSPHIVHHCESIRSYEQVVRLGDRLDNLTRDALFPSKGR